MSQEGVSTVCCSGLILHCIIENSIRMYVIKPVADSNPTVYRSTQDYDDSYKQISGGDWTKDIYVTL